MRSALPSGCLVAMGLTLLAFSGAGTIEGARAKAVAIRSAALKAANLAAYGALPLSFVPNVGQLDPLIRYSAQAAGVSISFTPQEAVLTFAENTKPSLALRLRFVRANPDVVVAAQKRQFGRVNYLRGNDRSKWRTNVATYGEVVYHDLWPGIDLIFRGAHGQLKYEFHVAAGASVGRIRLGYSGASGLSLDRSGNLSISTSRGTIRDSRPVTHEQRGSERIPVKSRFVLAPAAGEYGFTVEGYDRRRPLVIDPGLAYSTFLDWSDGWGIAVDSAGSAYVTGEAIGGFPITPGAFDTHELNGDVFVTKLNATGSAPVYSTFLGGGGADTGFGIAVDGTGGAYVTGLTGSRDFPTTPGAFDRSFNGGDVFVTKLNATGSALAYSTYLGRATVYGTDIAVDGSGSAYVTGTTTSPSFPTTAEAFDRSFNGGIYDMFVAKLNAPGSALRYATYLGGKYDDHGGGIAVDRGGSAYITGATNSPDFPTTAGAFDRSYSPGGPGGFVTKLNPAGSVLAYSTYLGMVPRRNSSGYDAAGHAIAVDGKGSAYITGFAEHGFPTTAKAFDRDGDRDAFVTKLNAAGSALVYSTYLGRAGPDWGKGIAVDSSGSAYVAGETSSFFPTTAGAFDRTYGKNFGGGDAFLTKLNAAGSALVYSTFLGGSSPDRVEGIAVDRVGSVYVTGETGSTIPDPDKFPTTAGAFATSVGGASVAFVTKMQCLVPAVVGMTLARARTTIRQAGCSVGLIRRKRSGGSGLVIEQGPRAGTTGTLGTKVNLIVGRR